ncbi:MAG: serine/threonine protein kinase [Proteobacteria bacterium]|nr:serine/threonine protein kinase [Pseudomonadota bacterium]MBU1715506.1 serine/threonine protein kinase [Pseudomonadota bacterium]
MENKPTIAEVQATVPTARIIEELGEGTFKVAFRAKIGGREEALKLVRIPTDPEDPTVEEINRRRAYREIDILAKCTSPFLVKLGQLPPEDCEISGNTYILYSEELVAGDSLRTRIRNKYRPGQQELAVAGLTLLDVIGQLAGMKVIHRDIKPENMVATGLPERPFVLLDLGIAFVQGGTRLTMDSGHIPGTLYYIAPEMLDVNFRQSLDYRADLYTSGLTLYEYATSINPFARREEAIYSTLYRIKHDRPRPLSELRPDLDKVFCLLINQLIKKLPALRPANLKGIINTLENYR